MTCPHCGQEHEHELGAFELEVVALAEAVRPVLDGQPLLVGYATLLMMLGVMLDGDAALPAEAVPPSLRSGLAGLLGHAYGLVAHHVQADPPLVVLHDEAPGVQ